MASTTVLPTVPPVFDNAYMKKRKHLAWRAPLIAEAITQLVAPYKIIDLGCAVGDIVNAFRQLGKNAMGVDSSKAAFQERLCVEHAFLVQDLTVPLYEWKSYRSCPTAYTNIDVVLCWETFSILPEPHRYAVAQNILRLKPKYIFLGVPPSGDTALLNLIRSWYFTNNELTRRFKESMAQYSKKQAIKAIYNSTTVFERGHD